MARLSLFFGRAREPARENPAREKVDVASAYFHRTTSLIAKHPDHVREAIPGGLYRWVAAPNYLGGG
jgi:hypothetical protein